MAFYAQRSFAFFGVHQGFMGTWKQSGKRQRLEPEVGSERDQTKIMNGVEPISWKSVDVSDQDLWGDFRGFISLEEVDVPVAVSSTKDGVGKLVSFKVSCLSSLMINLVR